MPLPKNPWQSLIGPLRGALLSCFGKKVTKEADLRVLQSAADFDRPLAGGKRTSTIASANSAPLRIPRRLVATSSIIVDYLCEQLDKLKFEDMKALPGGSAFLLHL